MHFQRFQVAVATVLLLYCGAVYGDGSDECPDPSGSAQSLITNYISADNQINGTTICRMEYLMPEGANLWQGMLAANQQHRDNFTFEATVYAGLGHFITEVNGVTAAPGYFWALFAGNGVATSYGADSLFPSDGDSFIWNYQSYDVNSTDHSIANYTGPCLDATVLPPSMPLTYANAYLTVSSVNTANFTNGTNFMPVCRQLVLFDLASSTLSDVLDTASQQVPLEISSTITDSMTVTTLNGLTNQDGFVWTPYNATSNAMLSRDLSATSLSDGDHIVFRFVEEPITVTDGPMMTTGSSATRPRTNTALYGLIAPVTTLLYAVSSG